MYCLSSTLGFELKELKFIYSSKINHFFYFGLAPAIQVSLLEEVVILSAVVTITPAGRFSVVTCCQAEPARIGPTATGAFGHMSYLGLTK